MLKDDDGVVVPVQEPYELRMKRNEGLSLADMLKIFIGTLMAILIFNNREAILTMLKGLFVG